MKKTINVYVTDPFSNDILQLSIVSDNQSIIYIKPYYLSNGKHDCLRSVTVREFLQLIQLLQLLGGGYNDDH